MRRYRDLLHRTDGPPGSAWGEFGPDDELGTIGRLTPDRARAGAACVRTGEVFNLDLPMDAMDPPLAAARRTARHTIFGRNAFHRDEHLDDVFPQASSQIDGLRHFGHPDHGFYNGASGERLVPGDPLLGMQHWAEHGIVGRAVLVDVARHRDAEGRPIDHRAGEPIPVADVVAAAERQGSRFEPGDLLLLRLGWVHHYRTATTAAERTALPAEPRHPGLIQSHDTLEWLWDNEFALVAADNFALEWAAGGGEPVPDRGRACGRADRRPHRPHAPGHDPAARAGRRGAVVARRPGRSLCPRRPLRVPRRRQPAQPRGRRRHPGQRDGRPLRMVSGG